MKIRTKITGLVIAVVFLNGIGASLGLYKINELRTQMSWLIEKDMEVSRIIFEIASRHREHNLLFERAVNKGSIETSQPDNKFEVSVAQFKDACGQVGLKLSEGIEAVKAMPYTSLNRDTKVRMRAIETELHALSNQHAVCMPHTEEVFQLIRSGQISEAKDVAKQVIAEEKELDQAMQHFYTEVEQFTQASLVNTRRQENAAIALWITITLLAFLIGGTLSVIVARRIVRSLKQAETVAGQIASGTRSFSIEKTTNDETGLLLEAMELMVNSLNEAEGALKEVNSRLEQKVSERTKELDVMNASLKDEIEERKRTEEELNMFIYKSSHDLRGPIASVIGLIDLALSETQDKETVSYLKMIDGRIKQLDGILAELININRIKQGLVGVERIEFDLLIKEILDKINFIPEIAKVDLVLNLERELEFNSDKHILSTILYNLIINGIKYRKEGVEDAFVKIETRSLEDKVIIVVSDNGQGVKNEMHHKVFDMFYRGTSKSDGSGLGLFVVNKAVGKLNGSIEMNSKPGVGTTFVISIPNQPLTEEESQHRGIAV